MAQSLVLHTIADDYNTRKALVTSVYCGVPLKQSRGAEFATLTLETPDGSLWQPNAILRYLARSTPELELEGQTLIQKAQVAQWLEFSCTELEPALIINNNEQGDSALKRATQVLQAHLLHHTYLVTNKITLADVAIACALLMHIGEVPLPQAVERWFNTCINQPQFLKVEEAAGPARPGSPRALRSPVLSNRTPTGFAAEWESDDSDEKSTDTFTEKPTKKSTQKSTQKSAHLSVPANTFMAVNQSASTVPDEVTQAGKKVRDLKAAKADPASIKAAVAELLALKEKHGIATQSNSKKEKKGSHHKKGAKKKSLSKKGKNSGKKKSSGKKTKHDHKKHDHKKHVHKK